VKNRGGGGWWLGAQRRWWKIDSDYQDVMAQEIRAKSK
jgi:hypothetical protein